MDICVLFEEDFIECIERGRMYLTIIPSFWYMMWFGTIIQSRLITLFCVGIIVLKCEK
jgi:hypothetical protein